MGVRRKVVGWRQPERRETCPSKRSPCLSRQDLKVRDAYVSALLFAGGNCSGRRSDNHHQTWQYTYLVVLMILTELSEWPLFEEAVET
jgi:hypothetical protein